MSKESNHSVSKQRKELRIELEKILEEFDEIHDDDNATVDDWNILLDDLASLFKEYDVEKIIKEYHLEISTYDFLSLISREKISSDDEIELIYDDLTSSLEEIILSLPKVYFKLTKWDKIPFISYAGFLAVFAVPPHANVIALSVAAAGMMLTVFCKSFEEKEKNQKINERASELHQRKEEIQKKRELKSQENETISTQEILNKIKILYKVISKKKKPSKSLQFPIFAAIFGLIATWGIVESLYTFTDEAKCINESRNSAVACIVDITTPPDMYNFIVSEHTFVVASFFAIAILFYHCGIITLTTDPAKLGGQSNKIGVFISSLIIFLEAILLFMAATNANSLPQFSIWIIILVGLDIVWIVLNIFARIDTLFQWLHLDSLMLLFLLILLTYKDANFDILISDTNPVSFNHIAVLVVFIMRAGLDYKMGWKYWSEFLRAE